MRRIVIAMVCAGVLFGCGAKTESPAGEQHEATRTPGTPAAVLASLYQPILEPFVATYTFTRRGITDTGAEETYVAIKSTVTQDAELDVRVLEAGRWAWWTPDHLLVSDELYVRVSEPSDEYDLKGVDAGQWVPYYEWVALNLEATESLVLDKEEFAPRVDPERPYLVRSPVALVQGEQFLPVPRSCVDFRERRPGRRVVRLDERRWKVTCETALGVRNEFITEYDTAGRLVRFYNTPESYDRYDLAIMYGPTEDIREPDTAWWQTNQPLVHKRLAELAARLYGE